MMGRMNGGKWAPWVMLGSILMMIAGAFKLIAGITGLFRDEWLLQGYNGYMLVDITGLAWWWVIVGALLVFGGFAAMQAKRWGYIVGIIAASVAAISEFFMMPYYPIWSIILVAMYFVMLVAFIKAPTRK